MKSVKSVVHSVFMKHEELTGKIIGAAMAVLNELKPGLEACGSRAARVRAGGITTDFTDYTDGVKAERPAATLLLH